MVGMTAAQTTAFDPAAPADERAAASAELHKTYAPRSESGLVLPLGDLAQIAAEVRADLYEMELQKAQVVPFPSQNAAKNKRGMQSVELDDLQISRFAEYWERPSALSYDQMRLMVAQTPILEAAVLTRVRQVQRFCRVQESGEGLGFAIRHVDRDHQITDSERESIQLLQRFIANCGWEFRPRERRRLKRDNFSSFMARSVRDSLVLDSAPIETEMKRDRALGIDGFYSVDGATIRLTPEDGYKGDPDVFALQLVQGRICTAYTLDDLIYEPRNPRSDVILSGYGMSEVELLVKIVTGFLNALQLNMRGFSDNAIPRGVMHLTGNYSQDDLVAFKRYWNAMVKGSASSWSVPVLVSKDQESKASFENFGIEFSEMYFSKWMTFLTSIVCAVYGMAPDEINFESFTNGTSSLSGNDTEQKLAASKDKGLRPLLSYYENLITDYIVSDFDEKYVFRWTGLDEEDEDKRHEMRKLTITLNEGRAQEGLDAIDGPLGDAPLNPSLIGPWMQLQQAAQPEDFGQPGADGGPGGEEGGQVPQEGEENADQSAQEPGAVDPAGQQAEPAPDGATVAPEEPGQAAEAGQGAPTVAPDGAEPEDEQLKKAAAGAEPLDFGVRETAVYRVGDGWHD